MYVVWQNFIFILLLLLLLATSFSLKKPHQANIKKKLKMLVHIVQKPQFYGIPFTFISSLYNYYQLLDILFVVSCVEILYCEYFGCNS
jgi:hypothetical protein